MTAQKNINYQELQEELSTIVALLQQDTTDIDAALKAYERGLTIVKLLETYLKTAETTITELKASFSQA